MTSDDPGEIHDITIVGAGPVGLYALYYTSMRDRRVLIVGGGDSAVDWALNLQPICRQVMLIHRSDRFRAHERSVEELKG